MEVRKVVKGSLARGGRVLSGPARGLYVAGPGSARIFLGLYEIELNKFIRQLVPSGGTVFDVGAQYGLEALMFANLGAANVLTVEADPGLRSNIQRNIERNALTERIRLHIGWVGDGTGDTITLDELATEYFMPEFVKLDIEGGESAALAGASLVLQQCDRWLVETHGLDKENECLQVLAASGFKIDLVSPRRWLPDRRLIHNRWIIAVRA